MINQSGSWENIWGIVLMLGLGLGPGDALLSNFHIWVSTPGIDWNSSCTVGDFVWHLASLPCIVPIYVHAPMGLEYLWLRVRCIFEWLLKRCPLYFAKSLSCMRRGLDYVGGWSYFRVNLETLENTPTFSFRATYKLILHWHIFTIHGYRAIMA